MKFNHGHWLLLPGTEAIYPTTVVDVQVEPQALTVTAFNQEIHDRGQMIEGTLLTARFTSPMPEVIRVQITHHKGRHERRPSFDLDYRLANPQASAGRDEHSVWLKAGRLSVVVPAQGQWKVSFQRDGEELTSSEPRALALLTQNGVTYLREQLCLQPAEKVYGLGEHFGPLVKNGQSVDIWNEDGGTDTEQGYKNVPFYLTNRGYGVLVNDPGKVSFEIASHQIERVQFSLPDERMEYYLFGGPTPKDVLDQYTRLSGRPALPPDWSFGLWLSTSFKTNYDEAIILSNIDKMQTAGIPVGVLHFDCFWMKEFTWCSFLWDQRYFPDPAG